MPVPIDGSLLRVVIWFNRAVPALESVDVPYVEGKSSVAMALLTHDVDHDLLSGHRAHDHVVTGKSADTSWTTVHDHLAGSFGLTVFSGRA